jgi:hypothetical protein
MPSSIDAIHNRGKILIQTFAIPFNTSQVIRNKGFTSVIQFKAPITVKSITETCIVSHIPEPSSRPRRSYPIVNGLAIIAGVIMLFAAIHNHNYDYYYHYYHYYNYYS